MSDKPVVIVGAGHAGVQAAAHLSELGFKGGIVLVDQENEIPYERPPLSKEMLKASDSPLALLRKKDYYADRNINLITGVHVSRLNRLEKEIKLAGTPSIRYSKLIIATGSKPRQLNVPGSHLRGIHVLKTLTDSRAIKQALCHAHRVVVIGAGYIGLEVAAAAAGIGCEVTVLEAQNRVMSRVTSEVVSRYFEELHRSFGALFEFGAGVVEFQGDRHVERVLTTAGKVHAADLVVMGIGVQPNHSIAEGSGIACADGILVDQHCRTSDPNVYAIGDVSRAASADVPDGIRLESVQNALAQAMTAANHIATGLETTPEVPWFWTIQHEVRLQTAGLWRADDEVVVRGRAESGRFSVLYLRNGRLVAIDTVGTLKDFMPAKRLIAAKAQIDRALAVDETVKLATACEMPAQ
jgi:3-phenylpropionate/trans-cinnamate dioxygenase ferredoxin reductase subunit